VAERCLDVGGNVIEESYLGEWANEVGRIYAPTALLFLSGQHRAHNMHAALQHALPTSAFEGFR